MPSETRRITRVVIIFILWPLLERKRLRYPGKRTGTICSSMSSGNNSIGIGAARTAAVLAAGLVESPVAGGDWLALGGVATCVEPTWIDVCSAILS